MNQTTYTFYVSERNRRKDASASRCMESIRASAPARIKKADLESSREGLTLKYIFDDRQLYTTDWQQCSWEGEGSTRIQDTEPGQPICRRALGDRPGKNSYEFVAIDVSFSSELRRLRKMYSRHDAYNRAVKYIREMYFEFKKSDDAPLLSVSIGVYVDDVLIESETAHDVPYHHDDTICEEGLFRISQAGDLAIHRAKEKIPSLTESLGSWMHTHIST